MRNTQVMEMCLPSEYFSQKNKLTFNRSRIYVCAEMRISAVITSFCSIKLDFFDEVVVIHIPIFSIYKITVVVKIELIHSEYYRDVFGLPLFFI